MIPRDRARSFKWVWLYASIALLVGACSRPPEIVVPAASRVELTPLDSYGTLRANTMLKLAGVKNLRANYRVDCYRVVYASTSARGQPVKLSGLLALPRGINATQLVSFQHGTTSNAQRVPSNLDDQGLAAALVFAGNGFVTIAPDYIGLGVSNEPHPYYVASDTSRAIVDMIEGLRNAALIPVSPPLLVGYSEGGYASVAAQRALEATGQNVAGTAAIAGAYNLRAISVPWTLKGQSPQASTYLSLWVRGYAARYGKSLESAFTPAMATLVSTMFDTPHESKAVRAALPRDPNALFRPEVIAAINGQGSHWLIDALDENDMGNWRSVAPIRLYYGTADLDVPYQESTATALQMSALGSDVQAIDVGPRDHNQTILSAAPLILNWFASIR